MTPARSKLRLVASAVVTVVALLWPSTAESPVGAATQPGSPPRVLSAVGWKPGSPPRVLSAVGWKPGSPPRVLSAVGWKPEPAAVRVTHELIRVTEAVSDAPRVRRPSKPARLASRKAVHSQKSEGIAARAGRVLLGDGRYRPEPFPRPGR